jgi:hypothetical protein
VANRIPTKVGDVLILRTNQSFSTFAVGPVMTDGQHDFHELGGPAGRQVPGDCLASF